MISLVLGGVRSGKSLLAENLAAASGKPVCYIATAEAGDGEMRARIDAHRARRPADWSTVEAPVDLAASLQQVKAGSCVLVDCLSLWLTNLLLLDDTQRLEAEIAALLDYLPQSALDIVMVSTESGLGVVPMGELSRRYCDRLGLLHQQAAGLSDRVILTVAGLPQYLKGAPD